VNLLESFLVLWCHQGDPEIFQSPLGFTIELES
jgi:hypothetical protein